MPRTRFGIVAGGLVAALAGAVAVVVPTLTADPAAHADSATVQITEFMASNTATAAGTCTGFPDWIELHNTSGTTADLNGMHLTDDPTLPLKWAFPAGTAPIAANGYRIVCVDTGAPDSPTFGLSKDGEYVALTNSAGAVVGPAYTFPAQFDDISYGSGSNGIAGYLTTPTPGVANGPAVTAVPRLARPTLSQHGGYIDGPVTVTAGGAGTLTYTTNNKAPKATSPVFPQAGLVVQPDTILRVAAFQTGFAPSTETDATFLSMAGVLGQTPATPAGWPASGVANGQTFVYGFDQTQVAANGSAISSALTSIPTLSIVTDQKDLTDPATGIYVNAAQTGSDWERSASVEYIDPAGAGFQINAGLRIKGGFSRQPQFPEHGFSLRFGDSYDGALTTQQPLFPDGIGSFASLDLRPENNASWPQGSAKSTFLRELWTRDTQQTAGDADLQSRRVELFLNGRYWGMYNLIERMSQPQAAAMYGGDPASYNVLKPSDADGYEVEAGNDADWRRLWDLTADQVVTDAEYAEISSLIDVTSLARFIAINAYTGNVDGAVSVSLSRALGNNWIAVGGPGHPYKFLATDAELSLGVDQFDQHVTAEDVFGPFPVLDANPHYALENFNPGWLHSALLSNPQYRAVFDTVAAGLLQPGGVLDTGPALARWDARKAEVAPLVWAEAARWGHDVPGGPYSYMTWVTETNWVETQFFPVRTQIVRDQLRAFLLGFFPGTADNNGYASAQRLDDAHPVA
jgi:hypothetical protein